MLPPTLPSLPDAEWPLNLRVAHNNLSDIYRHALRVLDDDQTDPIHAKFHLATIEGDAIPLLLAVEHEHGPSGLGPWLATVTSQFSNLFVALSRYCTNIQNQYVD